MEGASGSGLSRSFRKLCLGRNGELICDRQWKNHDRCCIRQWKKALWISKSVERGNFTLYERIYKTQEPEAELVCKEQDKEKAVYELEACLSGRKIITMRLLFLTWYGNRMEVFDGEEKINDYFYTGQEALLSLGYFEFQEKLKLVVYPLHPGDPIFLEKQPDAADGCACKIEEAARGDDISMNRERKTNMNQSGFIYGGDYNPEQWLYDAGNSEQDIEYMKEAHINEVTLGVFSWSVLSSRRRGVYHLEWLEKIMDQLYKNEISVNSLDTVCTPRSGLQTNTRRYCA